MKGTETQRTPVMKEKKIRMLMALGVEYDGNKTLVLDWFPGQ